MAKFSVLALVAVSVLLMSPINVYGMSSNAKEFTIFGTVKCQDCTKGYYTFANGAIPIQGAKVDITCPDKNGRPVYHYSDFTDATGVFSVTVPYSNNGVPLDPKDAIVRLVSSPTDCNIVTNFNHGKDGVSPQNPTIWHPDNVKYECGPFYFTTPQCAIPE